MNEYAIVCVIILKVGILKAYTKWCFCFSTKPKLLIIQCNPFSLARCVTSKKFRCQHNKENLRLVSAHILWGARLGAEWDSHWRENIQMFWDFQSQFLENILSHRYQIFSLSIYSFSGADTFYHLRWYKTEKTELKGNEVIRKKCGTIFGDIYKLLEAI